MQRRKFVIGMGALASGTAAAVGTGAFSFVRADRDITVDVVGDANAYLGLEATSEYADYTDGGQLELDFGVNSTGGEGLNANADSRFDDVFRITNQGTNDARISFHDTPGQVGYDSPAASWFYSEDGGWEENEIADNPVIAPGESIYVHVIFWLTEFDEGDIPDHLGIVAEEP